MSPPRRGSARDAAPALSRRSASGPRRAAPKSDAPKSAAPKSAPKSGRASAASDDDASKTRRRAARSSGPSFFEGLRGPVVSDPALAMQRRVLYLMLAVVAVLGGAHVWVALHIQDLGYETEYVNRLIARLDRERLELQTEEARETTPGLVAERARAAGLNLPERGQIRRLHAQP